MNAANLKKDSLPSNSELCEACKLEDLVKQVQEKGDFLEKVFGALISTKHEHIRMSDQIMVALRNREIYHALDFLFEDPLHHYHCLNNAVKFLPLDEMSWDSVTPLMVTMRIFSELKDALLAAHLSTVNSIS